MCGNQILFFRKLVLTGLIFFTCASSFGQSVPSTKTGSSIVLIDSVRIITVDSLSSIPLDSAQILKNETRKIKTEKAFKVFSYFKYKDSGHQTDFIGEETYKNYSGKKIRSIQIKIYKPFGDIEEDGNQKIKKGQKFGNKIHFRSREWYVKEDILFHEGDNVQPSLFADTEKLLWERNKFKDVRILLTEDSVTNEVDVLVYLQDNLSWQVGLGYNNRVTLGISTYNFFGLPNTLSFFAGININKYNLWAVGGAYKYENIKASQINFTTNFLIERLNQNVFVALYRNFFSVKTKWAFNIKYTYDYSTKNPTGKPTDTSTNIRTKSHAYSLWLAYALPLGKIIPVKDDKLKLIFAIKTDNIRYRRRPFLTAERYDLIFVNQQNYRFGIGVARWDYYLSVNSFYIDVAEYFPRGYSASLWSGLQFDEVYRKRVSVDFTFNYGVHFKRFGYLYPQFNFSGYIRNKKGEEMVSKINLDYVSKSVALSKKVYFRQIIKVGTKIGINYPEERYFNINKKNGLRGFYSPFLKGSRNFTLNAECDLFFARKVLLTKAMTYIFCDMAWISENNQKLFRQGVYQYGVGFGLRLRSTSLGLPYLDVQFSFYPKGKNYGEGLFQFNAYGSNPNAITQNNMLVE